jgi:predicted nucleotidyltransferase
MNAFGLRKRDLGLLIGAFQKVPNLMRVYVYGSRARGTFKPTSDLDLAAEFARDAKKGRVRLAWELEDLPVIYKIDVVDAAELPEGAFKDNVMKYRKLLYERSADAA